MGHGMWGPGCEPSRSQHGGRGRGRHGHGGHGSWGGSWGGAWGGPMGGPPPWVAQMFGPEFGGPRGGRGGRGKPRVRRGDVRTAIIDVLNTSEEPINGYQIIQQIAERTDDAWKPSPGSIYPTIAQLQDEGLVEDAPTGRKALQLTDEGRAYAAEHADELAALWKPFAKEEDDEEALNFKQVIGQTVGAIVQVATSGTPEQRDEALRILGDTRRRLYSLLAEGPESSGDAEGVTDEDGPDDTDVDPGYDDPRGRS